MSGQNRDSENSVLSLLVGVGVGVVLGGAAALLLAPQSGSLTRLQLRESADDALGKLRESMDDLRTKVEEVATSAREAVAARRESPTDTLHGDVAGATDEIPPVAG
ncbi:MAG TPA: YtxH domain-containing protein [Armatimonadota bacterium]|nr:YtxH domain-containing protein [Armatimonadota bacterium]